MAVFLVLSTLNTLCLAELSVEASQTPAYRTALALNYAHAALYTITDYNDRVVLDQEYREILNNIKLSAIQDEEVIDLLKKLLDTLNQYLLSDQEQEVVKAIYQNKIDEAFYESLSTSSITGSLGNAGGALAIPLPAGSFIAAGMVVSDLAAQMVNYREHVEEYRKKINRETWELKKEQAIQLTNLRKQFLMYYWNLMRKYKIPDQWRITEKQFATLLDILKDTDKNRQYRRLDRIKGQFEAYPPFWYYLGKAAQTLKRYDAARAAYDFVIDRHFDYFRDDTIYASILLNRIQLYSYPKDKEIIETLLDKIVKVNPSDGSKMLAVALYLGGIGHYPKAINLLQRNIDENFMVVLNTRLLTEFNVSTGSKGNIDKYRKLIRKMIRQVDFKHRDIIYLIGKTDDRELLRIFSHRIKRISFRHEEGWMDTYLYVTLAKRWVLYKNDEAILPTLTYLNGKKTPDEITVDKVTESVTFRYSGFLPLDEFPSKKFPYEFRIQLPSRDTPINLTVKYFYEEEKEETNQLIKNVFGLFAQEQKPATKKVPKFVYYQLETNNNCYRIVGGILKPKSCR